jgi:hypothetical protein
VIWPSSTRCPTAEVAGASEELPSYFDGPPLGAARLRPTAEAWWDTEGYAGGAGRAAPAGAGHLGVTAAAVFGSALPLEPLWSNRTGGLSVTFVRAVDLPFAACSLALAAWWERAASGGVLRLGRGRLLGPPRPPGPLGPPTVSPGPPGGPLQVPVLLSPGFGCPPRPLTLELLPWFETFGTKMALQPNRAVRGSRRYFAAGHDLLDRVIAGVGAVCKPFV